MYSKSLLITIVVAGLFLAFHATQLFAQSQFPETPVKFAERNLGGPRPGLTYIPGKGELAQKLEEKGICLSLGQFGFHFE